MPPEISVSILAEVIAAKNGVTLPTLLQVKGAKAAREIARSVGSSCDIHG
jgi:xanthine dehydrogenase accessory factor